MESLWPYIGKEQNLDKISSVLKQIAMDEHPALVGAHHLCCSDETELECIQMLTDIFVKPLLPTLKLSQQSPFRTANLGARYEWGSIGIAEHHFATNNTNHSFKFLALKINAHVSRETTIDGVSYGHMDRYNEISDCCGALFGLMKNSHLPAIEDIREVFNWESTHRLEALTKSDITAENQKGLLAAITQARLQARVAMVDIQNHTPRTPTLYCVVPCVTINIPEIDKELLVGVYTADFRGETPLFTYRGLGDDPAGYHIKHSFGGKLEISSEGSDELRPVRDHRKVALDYWLQHNRQESSDTKSPASLEGNLDPNELLDKLYQMAPVEGALRLFAEKLAPVHHVFRADRIARQPDSEWECKAIFDDVRMSFEDLSQEGTCQISDKLATILSVCNA